MNNIDFLDFDKSGYVIVKNFFEESEINLLIKSYKKNENVKTKNYVLCRPDFDVLKILFPKLLSITKKISLLTSTKINLITPESVFPNTKQINFGWHQEHNPFWTFQQLHNYVNLYSPIIKTNEDESGLDIIPFDILKNYLEEHEFNKLVGAGANTFVEKNNTTIFHNDSTEESHVLNVNFSKLKLTPKLNIGDLLIMRGDLIHATQDVKNLRVAISIRFVDENCVIDKNVLLSGSNKKKNIIDKYDIYSQILESFNVYKTDKLTARSIFGNYHQSFIKND